MLMQSTTWKRYFQRQNLGSTLRGILRDARGHDLVEYAMGTVLIAGAAAAGVTSIALKIIQAFNSIAAKLTTYTS